MSSRIFSKAIKKPDKIYIRYSCNGNFPRDFDIVGNYIISTNEKSDSITVFDKNFNVKHIESNVKSPICVVSRDA